MSDGGESLRESGPAKPAAAPLPDGMTWALLLGRWVDFARSAVALPRDADGRRLRESVPDIIMLQAVWFALHHLQELTADERSLGLDRAAVLIDKHEAALLQRWNNEIPAGIEELVRDARKQWAVMGEGLPSAAPRDGGPLLGG